MGKIKKILENELLGGTTSNDVYPITSTQAVYTSKNEKLSDSYIKNVGCEPSEEDMSLILKSESDTTINTITIPTATTEKAGVMSAEDKKYTLSNIDKTVTLVSSSVYEPLNLGYIIPKGASVHIEGDFKSITCRTNPSDTEYQTISGDGIADRDITYIKMSGVGTATMTIKGVIPQEVHKNSTDITAVKNSVKNVISTSSTLVSTSANLNLYKLETTIVRGSKVLIEGDFDTITCRTTSSDTEYQTISKEGIADRDINYVRLNGVGTVTIRSTGPDFVTVYNKVEEATCLINKYTQYPARKNGTELTSGESFLGYEIDLETPFSNGYRYIKVRASSRYLNPSSESVVPAIIIDKEGNVEYVTPITVATSAEWYTLPITENSKLLRATYIRTDQYPKAKFIPYKYQLLEELPSQNKDFSEDISNINEEIAALREVSGTNITLLSGKTPARLDGSNESSGTYKGYEIDLTGVYERGYKFIRCRASSYVQASTVTSVVPCIVYNRDGGVEYAVTDFELFSTAWYVLPITENSLKVRCTYSLEAFTSGSKVYDQIIFEPYKYDLLTDNNVEERLSVVETTLGSIESLIDNIDIFLPPEIYILKGRMTQLFFRGFIKAVDPYVYDIKVQCGIGKTYKRYYEISHDTVGDFPFKIEVRDDNRKILGVAETTIKIVEPSSTSAKNILCCGASATEPGHWAGELKKMLTSGSSKYEGLRLPMSFVGRKRGSSDKDVQLEATGGWSWSTFISAGVPAVRFYVTGMTGNIGIGTNLTLNDPEKGTLYYSVLEVNLTEGVGNIRCGQAYPNPVVLPSSISGTLTGDSISITYNNAVEERFTPFYNAETGEVDFKTYANNYCNGGIDILITHMGVNSVLAENSSTPESSIKTFLNGFFNDFPNSKILVSAIPFPDYGTNVYTNTYKENNTNRYGSLCSFFDYNKNLYEISQLEEYKGKVVYCPSNVFFDTDYGYPKTNKDVNSRITSIKESIDTNGVHPIKEGSYLIADSILPTIITL